MLIIYSTADQNSPIMWTIHCSFNSGSSINYGNFNYGSLINHGSFNYGSLNNYGSFN